MTGAALRRAIHAASGAVLFLIRLTPPFVHRPAIAGIAVAAIVVDVARIRHRGLRDGLARALPVFRPSERGRLCGASWLFAGYAIAVMLPARAAWAGILVGAIADPAAAIVGERFGGGRRKSWPGTVTAAVTGSTLLVVSGFPAALAVAAGAVGAAVERWSGAVNDNLLMAPAVAAVVAPYA